MSPSSSSIVTLRQFQSETDAIREAPIPKAPRFAIKLMAALLLSAAVITCFVPVDRVVTSESGQIVPTEAVVVFQALDPSIIKSIEVKEGQSVKQGQVLATLDQTFAAADVVQLKLQLAGLDAQIERAEAELAGRVPDFAKLADPDRARYAAIQQSLYLQRVAQYQAQMKSFADKVSQTEATIAKYQNDEGRYAEREKIAKEIQDMRSALVERQAGSLLNLYGAQDSRLEMLRQMELEHNSLLESRQLLASLKADEEAFRQQWAATLSQELVTARNARDQAQASLAKAARHQDLVVWRAPEDGVVLTMAKLSVGSVLREGDQLLTMMPLRSPVEAEVRVLSRDVGFLRVGDHATLKVDAFNASEHGTAEGHVAWISEGAFTTDEEGKPLPAPVYKVHVKIDTYHFAGVPLNFRLLPGMGLRADLKIGRRSLARYFFGGAMRGLGESMREP
jgi:HlyD family secretion protein